MRAVQGQRKEGMVVSNRYQIEELLGIGALGEVYACRDLRGEKSKLVIKTMSFMDRDFGEREALCRNLSLMQRLRHPNIVRIMDFGIMENSGELFFVEERVYGLDLYSATRDMECEGILSLVVELCRGLQYLHAHGIVFGNLRPSSVILLKNKARGERLKLLDFYLKGHVRTAEEPNGQRALSYAAPEILMGGSASKISDMYALGILLYQLLNRHLPFEDEDAGFLIQKQLQGAVDLRPIEGLRKGVHLAQLLHRLLEKDPTKRMTSAEEVISFINKTGNEDGLELESEKLDCAFSAAPFVGREREMELLQKNARRVRDNGRGWTIFIAGEAGSGKSRCMEELRIWALLEGWRIVDGSCGACEESAYGPYRQILSRTDPIHGEEALFRFSNLPRIADSDPFDASSGFAAGQFQDLLTRELVRRLAEKPTILFLHDFHWADKATCTVLDYLSSDIQAHPVLMCVSLRSGEESKGNLGRVMELVIRHERGEAMTLSALSKENIQQMVVGLMGDSEVPESLGNWLFRAVGGNPFFLEEMLKHLVEQGVLCQKSREWQFLEEKLKNLEVPPSIGVVLQKRLECLSPSAKSLMKWLSLFHRAVSLKSLSLATTQSIERVIEIVDELVQRQMVRLESSDAMETIDFTHDLISEIIRGSIPLKLSVQMHSKIAEVIEVEGGVQQHLHELAMHYIEGKSDAHSMRYVIASAALSRAEFAHENALRCFKYIFANKNGLTNEELCRIAIDASDTMFALGMAKQASQLLKKVMQNRKAIAPELRARMYMQLALSYQYIGDFRKQESCCKSGLRIFQRHPIPEPNLTKAMLWAELGFGAVMQSHSRQGLSYLDKALKCCPDQDATALKGRIQIFYASLYCVSCRLREALAASERAANILTSSKDSYLACSAVSTNGGILTRLGRFPPALEIHKQAVSLSDKSRSVVLICQAFGNLAECLCRMGRIQEALNAMECGAKSVGDSNNPAIRHAFNTILAEVKFASGCYGEARQIIHEICRQGGQSLTLFTVGHAYYIAAYLDYFLGDFQQALKNIDQLRSKETAEAPFYEHELAEALRARILFEKGSVKRAVDHLQLLDQMAAKKRWPYQMCIIKIHICEIYLKQHKLKQAERYAKNALRLATAMGAAPFISHAHLLLGLIGSPLRSSEDPLNFDGDSGGASNLIADKAIEELKRCCQITESACYPETTWRALSELSLIYRMLGNWDLCFDYAERAYECLCRLEDQIPSNMLCAFYGAFDRSRIKSKLIRLMEAGRKRTLQRAKIHKENPEDENTRILLRLSNAVNTIRELDPLLEAILDQIIPAISVERALIFLRDEYAGKLTFVRGRRAGHNNVSSGEVADRHTLETVCREGRPLVSMDLERDPRLNYESTGRCMSGKLLCAPLRASGRVIGVIYADRPTPEESISESCINLFAAACNLAAIAIDNIVRHQPVFEANTRKQFVPRDQEKYPDIIGICPAMESLKDRIGLAAASPLDILITGESGTGKELVARAISRTGRRHSEKFIPVDCGALSDGLAESELFGYRKGAFTGAAENRQGLLEAANGGILFLDEISNMPSRLQAKLLRVLQEREVRRIGETSPRKIDIQVIAATNKDLMEETRCGRFRQDLLYRLKAMEIQVPPLRERAEDIPLLIEWFLERAAEQGSGQLKRFLPEAMELLMRYSYPGNIRELKNIVASAYYSVHGSEIKANSLPPEVRHEEMGEIGSEADLADRLYRAILAGKGNFDSLVKEPFMRHQFGSSRVRSVLQSALRDSGGRYRDALSRLGVSDRRYSTTIQFLKRHQSYVDYRPFRRKRSV